MQRPRLFLNLFFKGFLDLLFPPRCLLCGTLDEAAICKECHSSMGQLPEGSCLKCATGDVGNCSHCTWMSSLDWLRGAVDYQGAGGLAVRQLKFNRNMELLGPMGALLRDAPHPHPSPDFIVPVPIHWSRRAQRGFNQAELLADHLDNAPARVDVLFRRRATPPQARAKGARRRQSLKDAFASEPLNHERILLIDDVVTSGGTLEACASTLKAAGASWVGALTFARELSKLGSQPSR